MVQRAIKVAAYKAISPLSLLFQFVVEAADGLIRKGKSSRCVHTCMHRTLQDDSTPLDSLFGEFFNQARDFDSGLYRG
jgi:hypothetical protein